MAASHLDSYAPARIFQSIRRDFLRHALEDER
jgi:hypothetical protein